MTEDQFEEAVERLSRQIRGLQEEAARATAIAKQDAERALTLAMEDRLRLADKVKEGSERQATEVAEKVVKQMMTSLGLDPEKPGDFVRDMMFLRELRETFGQTKRHAIGVLVGIIMMGMASGLWFALKTPGGIK